MKAKEYKNLSPSLIFEEIKTFQEKYKDNNVPNVMIFSNGIKVRLNSKLRVFALGNTHCICCGKGKRESDLYFQYTNDAGLNLYAKYGWKSVKLTVDHNLLKSLGGIAQTYNLNTMCEDCNNFRGNSFAQVDEFIYWFNHPNKKPITQKNFSYIDGREGEKEAFKPYDLPFDE